MSAKPPPTDEQTVPADDAPPELEPLDLDEATYLATAEVLRPEDLEHHLRTLVSRAETLLARLRAPDLLAEAAAAAELAHALGGSGSLFGLQRLAIAARRFEQAVERASSEIAARAMQLAAAANAAMAILRELIEAVATDATKS